jgi:hypothetical protein
MAGPPAISKTAFSAAGLSTTQIASKKAIQGLREGAETHSFLEFLWSW